MPRPQRKAPVEPRADEWTALEHTNDTAHTLRDPELVKAHGPIGECPAESTPRTIFGLKYGGFLCTRKRQHKGRHIALGLGGVMAAWPGRHRPTIADLEG